MKLQFDGELNDTDDFLADLKQKGHKVVRVDASRWIGRDANGLPFDRGGRIDVEVLDDHQLPQKRPALVALEAEMDSNPKVKRPNNQIKNPNATPEVQSK